MTATSAERPGGLGHDVVRALQRSTDLDGALQALAAGVPGELHLLTGGGATGLAGRVGLSADLVVALTRRLFDLEAVTEVPLADGQIAVAAAVRVTPDRRGRARLVAIVSPGSDRSELPATLSRGAEIVAGHLRGLRAVRRGRQEMAGELLRRTMSGAATADELSAWARALQVDVRGHVVCLVVQSGPAGSPEDLLDAADAVEDAAEGQGVSSLVAILGSEVVALLFPGTGSARSAQAALDFERVAGLLVERSSGVIGRSSVIAQGMLDVSRAVLDARRVCDLERLRHPEVRREETGPAVPLATTLLTQTPASVAALHAAVLAPLESYDVQNQSDLLHTLDVFLSTCGGWSASANELGIHVNTLRYRLARVEKCTGRDLGSMADRTDFYVALRARSPAPR